MDYVVQFIYEVGVNATDEKTAYIKAEDTFLTNISDYTEDTIKKMRINSEVVHKG